MQKLGTENGGVHSLTEWQMDGSDAFKTISPTEAADIAHSDPYIQVMVDFVGKVNLDMLKKMIHVGPCMSWYAHPLVEAFLHLAIEKLPSIEREKVTPEAYGDAIHLLINVYCSIAFKKNQGQKCGLGEMTDKKKEAVKKNGNERVRSVSDWTLSQGKIRSLRVLATGHLQGWRGGD